MICYNTIVVFVLITILCGALVPLFLKMSESIVMPGRGKSDKYLDNAAHIAEEIINEHFKESSDEVQAAVVKGVFDAYVANIIPSYILETEEY